MSDPPVLAGLEDLNRARHILNESALAVPKPNGAMCEPAMGCKWAHTFIELAHGQGGDPDRFHGADTFGGSLRWAESVG